MSDETLSIGNYVRADLKELSMRLIAVQNKAMVYALLMVTRKTKSLILK